jgi:hypothetical protein
VTRNKIDLFSLFGDSCSERSKRRESLFVTGHPHSNSSSTAGLRLSCELCRFELCYKSFCVLLWWLGFLFGFLFLARERTLFRMTVTFSQHISLSSEKKSFTSAHTIFTASSYITTHRLARFMRDMACRRTSQQHQPSPTPHSSSSSDSGQYR